MRIITAEQVGLAAGRCPVLEVFSLPNRTKRARLLAVGDIGLYGSVAVDPFERIRPVLTSGDLLFGNLEGAISARGEGRLFACGTGSATLLSAAGFGVLSLANNHVLDHGSAELRYTIETLSDAGISVVGAAVNGADAGRLTRTDRSGIRIGWLACARTLRDQRTGQPGYWELDEDGLGTAARNARDAVDILIVSIHAGLMYLDYPEPSQRELVRHLLENGAHLVLLHHAHVLQGVEVVESNRLACYSLGNFVLDIDHGNVKSRVAREEQTQGGIFVFDMDAEGICAAYVLPTVMTAGFGPSIPDDPTAGRILKRLRSISDDLASDYSAAFLAQRSERNVGIALRVMLFHLVRGNWSNLLRLIRSVRAQHVPLVIRWLGGKLGAARREARN